MKNFTIRYPSTATLTLGTLKTTKHEWNELPFPDKVLLLGKFVKHLIPDYEYEAVDFIPKATEPWACRVKGADYSLSFKEDEEIEGNKPIYRFILDKVICNSARIEEL